MTTTPTRLQRASGQCRVVFDLRDGETRLADLYQRDPCRVLFPKGEPDDPPQAVLTLDGRALRFGATDAIDGDRYVDTGDAIALVPDRFSALLFEPAEREIAREAAASQ